MKRLFILAAVALFSISLTSCNEETTKVSKSVFDGDTVVSTRAGNGTFTRTQYGSDIWGNNEIDVSRGHGNASQQEDLVEIGFGLLVAILEEFAD